MCIIKILKKLLKIQRFLNHAYMIALSVCTVGNCIYNHNSFVYGRRHTDTQSDRQRFDKNKKRALNKCIAPFINIAMHKVQMHASAIRNLLYGMCVCTGR